MDNLAKLADILTRLNLEELTLVLHFVEFLKGQANGVAH